MADRTAGLHHVTAIARSPADNVAFYSRTLGLRLVKRTVNFDDQFTHHLYYGDRVGTPGTVLTFFPYPEARRGRVGRGQVGATAFAVPPGSIGYWDERLGNAGVETRRDERFGDELLSFVDPDGQPLELVAAGGDAEPWPDGPVPVEHAIQGFHSVTVRSADSGATIDVLELLGLERDRDRNDRIRYRAAGDRAAAVDLLLGDHDPGWHGAGTVHHIAFRAADEAAQDRLRDRLIDHGRYVTGVKDRQYFLSVYFREPGGVLFEIATDGPGFERDETADALGTGLKLPPWLEEDRDTIERQLPPLSAAEGPDAPSSP